MKLFRSRSAALSLVETMVTVAVITLAGTGIFEVYHTGMILFGKNSAINLSHSQTRFGLLNFQQDLSTAVSTPQLTGSAIPTLTGSGISTILTGTAATGSAAGVSFQAYAGGPFCLYVPAGTTSVSSSATSIQVITGSNFKPLPGETIHIQVLPLATSLVEAQLSGASNYSSTTTSAGLTYSPTLTSALGTTINLTDPISANALHIACFFTTPIEYVVQNGRLLRYSLDPSGGGGLVSTVLAYNVVTNSTTVNGTNLSVSGTSAITPFSVQSVNSSPANTFVQVQNLNALDPSSNYRAYKGVLTPFTVQIPHFSQMTTLY